MINFSYFEGISCVNLLSFGRKIKTLNMETISIVAVLILVCSGHHGATALEKECKVPADIVFILDESNSIDHPDFMKQLEFVNKVINHFSVDEENIHIGVMSFGRGVNTNILALGEFLHNPEAMKNRILAYNDERPTNNDRTRTDLALERARTDMFRNARRGIPHIAIIITDGEPNIPNVSEAEGRRVTERKADELKATGVTLFAIGVGKNSYRDQLLEMATDNSNDYVFHVDSYSVLEEIEDELTTVVCPDEPNIPGCKKGFKPLDVMFAAADEAGVADTVHTLDFFIRLTGGMEIAEDQVKVSLSQRNCLDREGIAFDDFTQKQPLERALRNRRLQKTYLSNQFDDIYKGFLTEYGSRPMDNESKLVRIALVVVDNQIANSYDVAKKAREMEEDGIRLYVIGVGQYVDEAKLESLVSNGRRYFYSNSYSELYALVPGIMEAFCKEITN